MGFCLGRRVPVPVEVEILLQDVLVSDLDELAGMQPYVLERLKLEQWRVNTCGLEDLVAVSGEVYEFVVLRLSPELYRETFRIEPYRLSSEERFELLKTLLSRLSEAQFDSVIGTMKVRRRGAVEVQAAEMWKEVASMRAKHRAQILARAGTQEEVPRADSTDETKPAAP